MPSDLGSPQKLQAGRKFLPICLIAAACLAVFFQVREHQFLTYDDPTYVAKNPHLQRGLTIESIGWAFGSGLNGKSINASDYWPLSRVSHAIDFSLFGGDPAGHHLMNVFLHTLNAILLFGLATAFFQDRRIGFWVAIVFAVHPVQVEPVCWVTSRKDLLSAFFGLLTVRAYWNAGERWSPVRAILLTLLFTAALLSKTSLILLPALLPFLPRHRRALRVLWSMPLFAVSGVLGWLGTVAQTVALTEPISVLDRLGRSSVHYVFYLKQFFWPADLAIYSEMAAQDLTKFAVPGAVTVLALVTAVAARSRVKWLFTGWMWFLVLIFPATILPIPADRYLYFSSIGLLLTAAAGMAFAFKGRRQLPRTAAVGTAVVAAVLAWLSFRQAGLWKDSGVLFEHAVAHNPGNGIAWQNLGIYYSEQNQAEKSRSSFVKALELRPNDAAVLKSASIFFMKNGNLREAESAAREALAIDPNMAEAHNALGNILIRRSGTQEAIRHFEKAVQLKPDYAEALNNLGSALMESGDSTAAAAYFRRATSVQPGNAESYLNMAIDYERIGERVSAAASYRQAIAARADYAEAHSGLGRLLLDDGRIPESEAELLEALRIDPGHVRSLINLGILYSRLKKYDQSAEQFERACAKEPVNPHAWNGLALVRGYQGRYRDSAEGFRKVLSLDPDFPGARENLAQTERLSGPV